MKRFAVAGHLLTAAVGRDAARILTIHSGRFVGDYQSGRASTRAIIRHVTRAFDGIVAVNDDIAAVVRGFGAPVPAVVVIPAYLPPPDPPDTRLAAELRAAADGGRFVLVTSGYGRRDYGFDVLVRAIASNRMLADRCELVLCTYGDRDAAYMAEVERLAESLPHVRHLRDLTPDEFAAVLQAGSAYIRATTLDGDAVAIREAGAFGRQVIASDAVTRPAGCLVFAAGSIQGLATSIIHAMEDRSIGVMQDLGRDGERRLFEFYEQIWDGKRRAAG
ncbi:hypothetical protein GPROT2_00136 [Gammaproteobacteria bacterium]|nr:hypothetical protein GPROT2_00136 [Gammaproteobacteria bacterium]